MNFFMLRNFWITYRYKNIEVSHLNHCIIPNANGGKMYEMMQSEIQFNLQNLKAIHDWSNNSRREFWKMEGEIPLRISLICCNSFYKKMDFTIKMCVTALYYVFYSTHFPFLNVKGNPICWNFQLLPNPTFVNKKWL